MNFMDYLELEQKWEFEQTLVSHPDTEALIKLKKKT